MKKKYLLTALGLSALLMTSCDLSFPTMSQQYTQTDETPDHGRALPLPSQPEREVIDVTDPADILVIETTESEISQITSPLQTSTEFNAELPEVTTTPENPDRSTIVTAASSSSKKAPLLTTEAVTPSAFNLRDVPPYSSKPFVTINSNRPYFKLTDYPSEAFEYYSPLDDLGRCGECIACIGKELMPTAKREGIGMIKPSGWQLVRYDGIVDGNYLFNRCHLIGYQLTGENANLSNLITGTRYMNVVTMLNFENRTADYIRSTGNHVLYRVTPCFEGKNLLVTGVLMEAESVEDNGKGLMFNVFCYNIQPQIFIDYASGENHLIEEENKGVIDPRGLDLGEQDQSGDRSVPVQDNQQTEDYILNKNTKKFHYPYCSSVRDMKETNKQEYSGSRDELIERGYSPCGRCKP